MAAQDALFYSEPEDWYYPTRHTLGNALLKAGKNEEAEKVFREDIAEHPDIGGHSSGCNRAFALKGKPLKPTRCSRSLRKPGRARM